MMQFDLAMSTEDRQSRQCMSQCQMIAQGAPECELPSWVFFCFALHPQGTGFVF